jgi:hypothetical protein
MTITPNADERATEFLRERDGPRPVWVRAPKEGNEFYSGFSRSKLYDLNKEGKIRSVSIRKPGQVKGTRLFELKSILDFIERNAANSEGAPNDGAA